MLKKIEGEHREALFLDTLYIIIMSVRPRPRSAGPWMEAQRWTNLAGTGSSGPRASSPLRRDATRMSRPRTRSASSCMRSCPKLKNSTPTSTMEQRRWMKTRELHASITKCSMLQVQCYRTNIDGGHGWCAVCTDKAKRGEPGFCDPELVNMDQLDLDPGTCSSILPWILQLLHLMLKFKENATKMAYIKIDYRVRSRSTEMAAWYLGHRRLGLLW